MNKLITQYEHFIEEISAYQIALSTLVFDANTIAPKKGATKRNEAISYLSSKLNDLVTSKTTIELFDELSKQELEFDLKRNISLTLEDINKTRYIPSDVFYDFKKLSLTSTDVWEEAKTNNDYSLYAPYLEKVIKKQIEVYGYRKSTTSTYNQMLNDYEEGFDETKFDQFFDTIKESLVPLITKIKSTQKVYNDFLYLDYDIDKQKEFSKVLLEYLCYSNEFGYLSESAHPFSIGISANDTRITTKYIKNNIASNIFSVIHEVGHALYNHQVNPKYEFTAIANNISSGMHESQSRLLENYIGRRMSFWDNLYPTLQKLFPENLSNITQQMFVDAINASYPSLIRTDADELTYPLHILIRYELEKELINSDVDYKTLNALWNKKYNDYLQVSVSSDSEGIMQDIHWSDASIGYFPTYALGSAYAAQWINQMEKDLDVDQCLRDNKFHIIKEWLKENIHQYGALYKANDLLNMVCNEDFNPKYYVDYLVEKYSKLYNL